MFVQLLFWIVPLLFLGRREQLPRLVALQQQLAAHQRQPGGKRLQLTDEDRRFWVMLRGRRMPTRPTGTRIGARPAQKRPEGANLPPSERV